MCDFLLEQDRANDESGEEDDLNIFSLNGQPVPFSGAHQTLQNFQVRLEARAHERTRLCDTCVLSETFKTQKSIPDACGALRCHFVVHVMNRNHFTALQTVDGDAEAFGEEDEPFLAAAGGRARAGDESGSDSEEIDTEALLQVGRPLLASR